MSKKYLKGFHDGDFAVLKREVSLASGDILPAGTRVTVTSARNGYANVLVNGRIRTFTIHKDEVQRAN